MTNDDLIIVQTVLRESTSLSNSDANALTREIARRCNYVETQKVSNERFRRVAVVGERLYNQEITLEQARDLLAPNAPLASDDRVCQVEHAHWEGPMICGNPLPCRTHGGR